MRRARAMKVTVKNLSNRKVREIELPDAVFDYPYKEHLIHLAVESFRAAQRRGRWLQMRQDFDLRSREAQAVDQARVVEAVAPDPVVGAKDEGEQAEVGLEGGGEQDCVFAPGQRCRMPVSRGMWKRSSARSPASRHRMRQPSAMVPGSLVKPF